MSAAEILSLVSKIAYVVAGVSLVLALFFWFKFRIPSVISDLSGRTARKSIAKIREHNEKQQGKKTGADRKKAPAVKAEKVSSNSQTAVRKQQAVADVRPETGLLGENRAAGPQGDETVILDSDESPRLLDEDATSVLVENRPAPAPRSRGVKMTMLDEVILIHTDTVI